MDSGPPPSPAQVDQIISDTFPVKRLPLFVYDTLLTLNDEIRYIWKPRTNPGTILYYLARYAGLLNTFLNVLFGFVPFNINDARTVDRSSPIDHGAPDEVSHCYGLVLTLLLYFFVRAFLDIVVEAVVERRARPSLQGVLGPLQQTLSVLILCRFSLDLRQRNTLSQDASETVSPTNGTHSGTRTRTHISWTGMQNNPDTPSEMESAEQDTTTIAPNPRPSFGQQSQSGGPVIQRAVEYIHKELVNEFGESSSDLTLVDPTGRPSNVGSDELSYERSPMLLEVNFGEFRWPRSSELFTFTDIGACYVM
ncbi:hypothetical protein Clacol_005183 [Clathrus columnatus]|uniref:DUF6533 domain-containing protein n=1 Tax=Clathrus columnatus TaxID=1419009 RepID=A0AAV5ACN6_9AGAM|nr:hypothetical protein Clacol_005183 [Clathrus columnatus]